MTTKQSNDDKIVAGLNHQSSDMVGQTKTMHTKITKQSIHEEFKEEFIEDLEYFRTHTGLQMTYLDILKFYDTKIQQMLKEVVPKEITYEEAVKISANVSTNKDGGVKYGFNQAIQETRKRIEELGY